MSRFDQAKLAFQMRKLQKEMEREIITVEQGDGAVKIEITGSQKIKRVTIDPEYVDLGDIRQLERWLEDAIREALQTSQQNAQEKMKPFMGALGNLGL